jgi:hypothetical protein
MGGLIPLRSKNQIQMKNESEAYHINMLDKGKAVTIL